MNDDAKEKMNIKIIDFGLSKMLLPTEKSFDCCGSLTFMAPELLNKSGHRHEVDIWSTGCILYKILFRRGPFIAENQKDTIKEILESNP